MADNKTVANPGLTDIPVATSEATHSGDLVDVQLIQPVHVSGAEGSKTVAEITDARGLFTKVPDKTATGTIAMSATTNAVEFDMEGVGQPAIAVSGTWTGTIYFEQLSPNGTTWHPLVGYHYGGATDGSPGINAFPSFTSANGLFKPAGFGGAEKIRARCGVVGTGTATIDIRAGHSQADMITALAILGDIPDGVEDPNTIHPGGYPIYTGGWAFGKSGDAAASLVPTLQTLRAPVVEDERAAFQTNLYRELRTVASDKFNNGTIDANGESVVLPLEGLGTAVLRVSGTWTGTMVLESSLDGSTWDFAIAINTSVFNYASVLALAPDSTDTAAGNGRYLFAFLGGSRFVRVRSTAWTSGSATIHLNATPGITFNFTFTEGSKEHGATDDSSKPIKVGARAISFGANPTGVAAARRTNLYATRAGQLFTLGGHPNVQTLELAITAAQTNAAVVSVSAGSLIVVTQAQVLAANANTVFPQLRLGFGATTTPTTAGVVLTHPGIPAGGGVSRGDGSGIIGGGADGEDLRVTCDAPTGGSLRLLVSYFTIEG